MHKVIKPFKKTEDYYAHSCHSWSDTCELYGSLDPKETVNPCSHFDHCERPAVIWLYDRDGAPSVYGLCNQCYSWTHPHKAYWYRVVKVSPDFTGQL